MAFRGFLALLIGLIMALAPIGMPAMAAASPVAHHGAVAGQGHCDRQSQPDRHHKVADKGCCAAMCLGIAIAPSAVEPLPFFKTALRPATAAFRRGIPAELPTPPPRSA